MIQQVITKEDLKNALATVGVTSNMIIEVCADLSSFGYILGGARTVVDALLEIAEDGGTILMPLQFDYNSEPSLWDNPNMSTELWPTIRKEMPINDALLSDLTKGQELVDEFRKRDGVVFSTHPSVAFAAWGKYANLLCNRQSMHFPLADESPIARLYELKGKILLLGCDYDKCISMHLAEYHNEARPIVIKGCSYENKKGQKEWKDYLDLELDSNVFAKVGEIMQKKGMIQETSLLNGKLKFFSANDAVDETTKYFDKTIVYDLYR